MPSSAFRAAVVAAVLALTATSATAASEPVPVARFSDSFRAALAAQGPTAVDDAIVSFGTGSDAAQGALASAFGLSVRHHLRAFDGAIVRGRLGDIARLGAHPWVTYVQGNERLAALGSTAPWATRVPPLREPVDGGPYRDPAGRVLDGTGVGIAVVDSGIDATHPDLVNRVKTNHLALMNELIAGESDLGPGTHTDVTSGHGTHVAGIAAGDGTASNGTFRGTAPGATIYGYSAGSGVSIVLSAAVWSLDHIYATAQTSNPPIRVVNNSYGNVGAYNPNGAIERVAKKLATEANVTVVFAAGNGDRANNGGDGTTDLTSHYCDDPTPGVICVANYDDDDTGRRNGSLDSSSSRGHKDTPSTWPDISAPGAFITSTFLPTSGALHGFILADRRWAPYYGIASGTSMAAPHLAGIVALLAQANPSLTPAQIEDILLDTAHRFPFGAAYESDPQNPGGLTSFDKGAGLADALAAVQDPRVGAPRDGGPEPTVIAAGDGGDYAGPGAADVASLAATPSATGIAFAVTVADANDRPRANVELRVSMNVGGSPRSISASLRSDGTVGPGAGSPESVVRSGNTITFFAPYSRLGNPDPGTIVHNIQLVTFIGVAQDVIPSPASPTFGTDQTQRPMYAASITTQ